MGFLDKFKKKHELKEYPNEYSPKEREISRELAELIEKNPKLSIEEISKSSKISPIKNDHFTQDLENSDEFQCRQMALSYSMAGNLEECIDYCDKGLKINSASPYLLYMRGRTFSDLKQFEKGISDLAKAVDLREDFADAWYEIGRIHQMNNDMDNAILAYHKAQ
jgi:tetratricopeptide (TPR) repeat protein